MSRYAFDEQRHALLVCWPTGTGDVAATLAQPGSEVSGEAIQDLARRLTDLSAALWRTYTHPPGAARNLETNTEGWRREQERASFSAVTEAVTDPNLPKNGTLVQSYSPVEENAHRVGRALHAIGDSALTDGVSADVRAEMAAIEQAELGDLEGRARQAVMLSRAGASPVQVEAADRIFHTDPLGAVEVFTEVEPTAAAVAAAHWLQAAAAVASDASGIAQTQVVVESDNIQALPHETPTHVLERLEAGDSPHGIVTSLVSQAMDAAEGRIPEVETIGERVEQAEQTARRHGRNDPRLRMELLDAIRSTPLDPARPARDLLEDLISGIDGCFVLFNEYSDEIFSDGEDDDDKEDDEDLDDRSTRLFIELVRAETEDNKQRLL